MRYEWDDAKAAANLAAHGTAFSLVHHFHWPSAVVIADERRDYGESRNIAFGLVGDRVHVCVYTMRGPAVRVISFRKANRRETRFYVETIDVR